MRHRFSMFKLARFVAHTWSYVNWYALLWWPVYTSHGPVWPYILNHADVLWWRSHYMNLLTGYNKVCVYSAFNDQLLCRTTLWKGIRTYTTSALHVKELSSEFVWMVASAFPTHEPTEWYCRFFLRIITSCFQLWCCVLAVFFSAGITELPTAQHTNRWASWWWGYRDWWDHWALAVHPFWPDANQEFTPGCEW
jgi:hypothetical protein